MFDPHAILGVEQNADLKEIRRRYKNLCVMYHPDKHNQDKSAVTIFQIIQDAYKSLKESRKRIVLPTLEEKVEKSTQEKPILPGTNISEKDLMILGEKLNDPWFTPSFDLTELFGDVTIPDKKREKK
jgi:curved DNA-binding protein CbpA